MFKQFCHISQRYAVEKNRKDLKSTYKRLNSKKKAEFAHDWSATGGADWVFCFIMLPMCSFILFYIFSWLM